METQNQPVSLPEETMVMDMGPESCASVDGSALREQLHLPGEETIHSYQDISRIGNGGMGIVYEAKEPGLCRRVAIKILRKENRRRPRAVESLLREGRVTAQIDHPNVVPVYRIGAFDDAGAYFSMRRVSGKTLGVILQRLARQKHRYDRKYTLRHLLEIFISVCNGVAFAHSKGIIHRDLKPANIMLGKYGEVMVMDWGMGLCRSPEKAQERPDLQQIIDTGPPPAGKTISGTPCYMAPEQVEGDLSRITEKSDQYALGAILYAILTLRPAPFDPKMETEKLLQKVRSGDFPRPRKNSLRRHVPRELEAIALKAMSLAPEDRYSSVRALRNDVRSYLDSRPVKAYHPVSLLVFNFLRRHPAILATLLAAVLTFLGFYGFIRIQDYTHYTAELKLAEEHMTAANLDAVRLKNMLAPDSAARSSQEIWRSGGLFETTRQHFFWHSREICSALERALYSGCSEEEIAPLADAMYANIVDCIILRGDTESARNLFQNLSPMLKHRLDHVLLRHPEKAARLQLILSGQTEIELDSALSGEITMEHAENGTPGFIQLGEPPLNLRLPAGFGILYQKTVTGELVLPVNLTAGEKRKICLEAPPVAVPDAVYIQKGPYRSSDTASPEMRLTALESYYIDRREVTFSAYLEFWKTLPETQKNDFMPRLFAKGGITPLFHADGTMHPDFHPSMPVVGVTTEAAEAYCRFQAGKYGLAGRLPTTAELVKAARGTDTRIYPWGNTPPVKNNEPDISPYGVCNLVTGVRELCFRQEGNHYVCLGGSHETILEMRKINTLTPFHGGEEDVGFRCVYQIPSQKKENRR